MERGIERIAPVPIYGTDALIRRSKPLQATKDAELPGVALSPTTLERLDLTEGERVLLRQDGGTATLAVVADPRLPDGCAYLPAGVSITAALGAGDGAIDIVTTCSHGPDGEREEPCRRTT